MPRKLTATTGVLLALALVLAGCGGGDSSKTTSQSAVATTPATTTPATSTSAAKASKSTSKTTTTSKKTDAATTSGSTKKKPTGIGTDSSGPTKEATKKKAATKKTTTTSKKPVGVTPATGSGSGADTSDTGSGPASDRLAVVSVLRKYYQAFIDSDGAEACAHLTSEGQSILKKDGNGKSCAQAVSNLVKQAGPENVNRLSSTREGLHVNDITVTGNNATAQIGPASRLRLVQVDGRWYLRSPNVVNSNTG